MRIDPRNPEPEQIVPTDSQHPFHSALRKTLVLLKIEAKAGPIYFVVEGLQSWPLEDGQTLADACEYFYEEHTCPTNFIDVPLISFGGDHDPHGVFEVVDAIWMTTEYAETKDDEGYLVEAFPQLEASGLTIDGTLTPAGLPKPANT